MQHSLRIAAGAMTAGLAMSTLVGSETSAHLNNFYWSAGGHTLQSGSQSNMVGFWQTVGYTQVRCPGGYYDGIFGSNTVEQTKEMQRVLKTPGSSLAVTGVVNSTTWNAIQGAWVAPIGTKDNFQRLIPNGVPMGYTGNYTYYGGSGGPSADLAWGNSGGPIWKFKIYGSSNSWFNATTSRTMGSTSAC